MADFKYKIKSWPAMPRSEKRKEWHTGSGSMGSTGIGGGGASDSGTDKADKVHDHSGQLIRPQVLVLPQISPADTDKELREGEIPIYVDPQGVFAELPPHEITIYSLTLKVNGTQVGIYNPAEMAKEIDIIVPTQYTLPKASASVLGGIKVGTGLSIDANGVLSVGTIDMSGYLPLTAGVNKALTGALYTRGLMPEANNSYTIGSAAARYHTLYIGAIDGGSGDMGFWRQLSSVRKSFLFAGATRLSIGEGYAENNYQTYLYGSVINFVIGTDKVVKWKIDGSGNLIPNTANSVNVGSSAGRVKNLYANNIDSQTLAVSGKATASEVEVSGTLAIPTSAPTNPVSGKVYLYADTSGNYFTE